MTTKQLDSERYGRILILFPQEQMTDGDRLARAMTDIAANSYVALMHVDAFKLNTGTPVGGLWAFALDQFADLWQMDHLGWAKEAVKLGGDVKIFVGAPSSSFEDVYYVLRRSDESVST